MLWLGYDGLSTPYKRISAVLIYRAEFADRVLQSYGRVPANTLAVVVTDEGAYLPSSWSVQHLRAQIARWRASA